MSNANLVPLLVVIPILNHLLDEPIQQQEDNNTIIERQSQKFNAMRGKKYVSLYNLEDEHGDVIVYGGEFFEFISNDGNLNLIKFISGSRIGRKSFMSERLLDAVQIALRVNIAQL